MEKDVKVVPVKVKEVISGETKETKVVKTPKEKVVTNVLTVKVNDVKPQIMYVKRIINNYLVKAGINSTTSTSTKPESIKLSEAQLKETNKLLGECKNLIKSKYDYTTDEQMAYITNHLQTHFTKYIK